MASWLECSTPDRVVRVRVLAGDIVLCSWARHGEMLGVTLRGLPFHAGGSRNTPSHFLLMKPEISAGLMGLLARKQT